MTPGEILAYVTGGGGVLISLYTLFAKGRESAWTQGAAIRAELQTQIDDLRERMEEKDGELTDARKRLADVENQVAAMHLDRRTLLDYLRDVVGGQYDHDWCKRRAQELLSRMSGGGPP